MRVSCLRSALNSGLSFNDAEIFSLLSVTVYGAHKGFTLTLLYSPFAVYNNFLRLTYSRAFYHCFPVMLLVSKFFEIKVGILSRNFPESVI